MSELLLDEVDRCDVRQPERRGGVPEVVETDARRQAGVSECLSVGTLADIDGAACRLSSVRSGRFTSCRLTPSIVMLPGVTESELPADVRCVDERDAGG